MLAVIQPWRRKAVEGTRIAFKILQRRYARAVLEITDLLSICGHLPAFLTTSRSPCSTNFFSIVVGMESRRSLTWELFLIGEMVLLSGQPAPHLSKCLTFNYRRMDEKDLP